MARVSRVICLRVRVRVCVCARCCLSAVWFAFPSSRTRVTRGVKWKKTKKTTADRDSAPFWHFRSAIFFICFFQRERGFFLSPRVAPNSEVTRVSRSPSSLPHRVRDLPSLSPYPPALQPLWLLFPVTPPLYPPLQKNPIFVPTVPPRSPTLIFERINQTKHRYTICTVGATATHAPPSRWLCASQRTPRSQRHHR